jgi:hypothetical protein
MKTFHVTVSDYEFAVKATAYVNVYIGEGGDDPSYAIVEELELHDVDASIAEVADGCGDDYIDGEYREYTTGKVLFTRDQFIASAKAKIEARLLDNP